MEAGSIAEWVEGIAETVALIVALFLPIITERIKGKKTDKKLKRIGLRMAKKALVQQEQEIDTSIKELSDYKAYKKYIGIVFTFNDSQELANIFWDVDVLLKKVSEKRLSSSEAVEKIDLLLN